MQQLSIAMFAAASVLIALAVVAVVLRLYVRIFMIKSVGIDDYLIVAALAFYIVAESMVFNSTILTEGKNILELLEVITPATRSMYFGEVFYVLAVWALKLSIGTFLLRLVTQSKIQRYIIYAVILVTSLYNIAYLCMVIFQCTPVQHYWLPFTKGHCLSGRTGAITSFVHAALTGSSDLVFAALPVFMVWKLQMNLAMKISVAGLLGIGAIGGITTFVRMPYVKALEEATPLDFFNVTSRLAIWTSIEPGVGIIVGSVATLRPIFKRILGGSEVSASRGSSRSRSRKTGSKYLRSDNSSHPSHQLDTFTDANKKAGFTTTVIRGSVTKNGKSWTENESEEELNKSMDNFKDVESGIQRTVVFEAISESRHAVTSAKQEPFSTRGGFY